MNKKISEIMIKFKACINCRTGKDIDSFPLLIGKKFSYHGNECLACLAQEEKICNCCKEKKNKKEFRTVEVKGRKLTIHDKCKKCESKLQIERKKKIPKEVLAATKRKWRQNNKSKVRAYDQVYREVNKEKVLESKRKSYHKRNKNERNKYLKKYRSNPLIRTKLIDKEKVIREKLSDNYIIQCWTRDPIERELLRNNPQLIEAKRNLIKFNREIKQTTKIGNK